MAAHVSHVGSSAASLDLSAISTAERSSSDPVSGVPENASAMPRASVPKNCVRSDKDSRSIAAILSSAIPIVAAFPA